MYKVGMFGGTFNPLHIGHINNIIEASNMCNQLYVILFYSENKNEIDHKERLKWLTQVTKDMQNVEVIEIADKSTSKENYDWEDGKEQVVKQIKEQIDIVFCGDDYKGKNLFETLYPDAYICYFSRRQINISSTQIRENPFKYYEYIPNCVREFYNKKVIVIGTESCGKSTLVRNLAKAFNTTYVEEVGRDVCANVGGFYNMKPIDYEEILYKHKVKEIEKLREANKVLFVDTDALITYYYYKLAFGETNEFNENFQILSNAMTKLNHYDLWIYLEPDVAWIQDGTRTYGEEEIRQKNNTLLKSMLKELEVKYEIITGNYQERFLKSKRLVHKLLRGGTNNG